MLIVITALALGASMQPDPVAKARKDPVVCKKDSSYVTGSHLRRPSVCKLRSEWANEERQAQRELRQMGEKWRNPTPVPGARPIE
jgi:hypothetical protein